MKLTVLNSGSYANGYVLHNEKVALVIECGCPISQLYRTVGFNARKVSGALISHEHGDHSRYTEQYLNASIPCFCSKGTAEGIKLKGQRKLTVCEMMKERAIGEWFFRPFPTQHDCNEPCGFLIYHRETGWILFATDTYYLAYRFPGLSQVMIECNYEAGILSDNVNKGIVKPFVRDRTLASHMSLENCINTLQANSLKKVTNIVLLHLSGDNSDAEKFKNSVKMATAKRVFIATKGMTIDFNKDF
jgi:phosphoribosyl 1,2-cyclic phosphodiesterase